mmetsp:Transcript_2397/g.8829  ORF Transcript_2397/g.8829 Transcript_2397/m.8829 type:complete len:429 (+) Transcript_2397:148-1434(+)|eukprot:CAMPEP_0170140446 /NCGR_PEP_ID=MMETSP0033_2-20121228/6350_1 /TAXON_ID=195969 /ORGANISM="Dolichomastix tenuilepis, Strain CCMP3274" /LENGTH=428 /DNA_ID=CAMNT_0010376659 /DNA_START=115 /DNA_END=1401 /DNA_ORIENTATION=+
MGCGASAPQEPTALDPEERAAAEGTQEGGTSGEDQLATAPRTGRTRQRRLSHVGDGVEGEKDVVETREPKGELVLDTQTRTRQRRLSFFSTLDGMATDGMIAGEELAAAEARAAEQAEQAEEPAPSPVSTLCAYISKAGQEPGYKKTNQDNCCVRRVFRTKGEALFGCFDGHGPNGHHVSGFIKERLPLELLRHPTLVSDVDQSLVEGFLRTDEALRASRVDVEFSGSTVVLSHLRGTTLTTAWVGDSRAVLGREIEGRMQTIDLSDDHKPQNEPERERILRSNGRVEQLVDENGEQVGPFRVWLRYAWIPGLAMSRALGDTLAHRVGVSSEPEIRKHELTPDDRFIILASDGLWEFVSSEEAVMITAACNTPEEATMKLVDVAHERWMVEEEGVVDDITVVIVAWVWTQSAPAADDSAPVSVSAAEI